MVSHCSLGPDENQRVTSRFNHTWQCANLLKIGLDAMFEFRRLHYVIHAQLHAPLSFRLDGLLIISMKLKATDVGNA